MTARLFVAIWPDDAARHALSGTVAEAQSAAPTVRWQPPQRWHITLAFLGEAEPVRATNRITSVMGAVDPDTAQPLRLADAGAFGPVIWVGVEHGPWLADLAHQLQQALRVADRRFRAHLTVGRARGHDGAATAREVMPLLHPHTGPWWTPADVTLVESRIGPTPEYRIVETWPLARGGRAEPGPGQ
jgi:2'-5' RNA ligase